MGLRILLWALRAQNCILQQACIGAGPTWQATCELNCVSADWMLVTAATWTWQENLLVFKMRSLCDQLSLPSKESKEDVRVSTSGARVVRSTLQVELSAWEGYLSATCSCFFILWVCVHFVLFVCLSVWEASGRDQGV